MKNSSLREEMVSAWSGKEKVVHESIYCRNARRDRRRRLNLCGRASQDRRILARLQLSLSRHAVPVREPTAARTSQSRTSQEAFDRSLGIRSRSEFYLGPSEPAHN